MQEQEPAASAFTRAQALADLHRWDDAIALLGPAVASDPTDGYLRCLYAACLGNAGNAKAALEQANVAAALVPESEWAHRVRAYALGLNGDRTGAWRAANEAVRADPTSVAALLSLSSAARAAGRMTDAQAAAERALELAPDSPEPHIALGRVAVTLRGWPTAERHFREALRVDPENATAMGLLGSALSARWKRPEAVSLFAQASRLSPTNSGYRRAAIAAFGVQTTWLRVAASVSVLAVIAAIGAPFLLAAAGIAGMWVCVVAWQRWIDRRERASPLADSQSYLEAKRLLQAEARRWDRRGIALRMIVVGITVAIGFGFDVSDDSFVQAHDAAGSALILGFLLGIGLFFTGGIVLNWTGYRRRGR